MKVGFPMKGEVDTDGKLDEDDEHAGLERQVVVKEFKQEDLKCPVLMRE